MKWRSQGREFKSTYEKYKEILKKNIYIFGAGKTGRKMANVLDHYNITWKFIDNDETKQGTRCMGSLVIDIKGYFDDSNGYIIVCVGDKYVEEIVKQLNGAGLKVWKNYILYEDFDSKILPVYLMYTKDVIYIPLVQISLTERCTLKCRKCAHACNLVPKDKIDMSLEKAKESADVFFRFVDYVEEFDLIGGEPFLYKKLVQIIDYVGRKYRNSIGIFSITTNGTILPKKEFLDVCKKNKILIRISNYTLSIPKLKEQYELFIYKLESYGIEYSFNESEHQWLDYGFDYVNRHATPEQLEKVFDNCRTSCHEIRGSKFYYCVMARSVSENMGKNIGESDYLDLAIIDSVRDKMKAFEYMMGYSKKGYLDMCNYCHGGKAKLYKIPVAEQMEKT